MPEIINLLLRLCRFYIFTLFFISHFFSFGNPITSQLNCFQSNEGQWDEDVLYQLNTNSSAIIFYKNRISFALLKTDFTTDNQNNFREPTTTPKFPSTKYLVWDLEFEGANVTQPIGLDSVASVFRLFGNGDVNCKKIKAFKRIVYPNIYDNIDFVIYINTTNNTIEYDFILAPNADESVIKMRYTGIEGLKINDDQSITIKTAWGEFKESKPIAYIENNTAQIKVNYKLQANGSLGFVVDSNRNKEHSLIIDPVMLDWSSFLYGKAPWNVNQNDCPYTLLLGVDLDDAGNTYAVGYTNTQFPKIPGSYDTGYNWFKSIFNAFYLKINNKGDSLCFFNYIGGKSITSSASFISINKKSEAVITGWGNKGFPITPGAFDSTLGNGSIVSVFNNRGDSLKFSTRFPGVLDRRVAIILESGDVITAGYSFGNIPMFSNSYQKTISGGNYDAFIARIKFDGKSLINATYLGGSSDDFIWDIAINTKEDVYVVGTTKSHDFPVVASNNTFKNFHGGVYDGFLTKIDSKLSKVIFSNLIGGKGDEEIQSVFVNSNEDIYIAGNSNSNDFPISLYPKPVQSKLAGRMDLVAMKFFPNGANYRYSTYLGGSADEKFNLWFSRPVQIAATIKDEAIITGMTYSMDFPVTSDALQSTKKSKDTSSSCITLTKLSPLGDKLIYSSYLGGSGVEILSASKVKRSRCIMNIAVAGISRSPDFPTTKGAVYSNPPSDSLFGKNINYSVGFISKFSDTLKIEKPNFGNTIKTRCNDFFEVLDGLNQGAYRRWNNGDSAQFLLVNKAGSYWVEATYGCDTIRDSITIINPINKANFSISDTSACLKGNTFTFKETTQFLGTKRKESIWIFDDSSRFTDTIVLKSFSTPGIHSVKLISQSTSNCVDSISKVIRIHPQTNLAFTFNDSIQCLTNNSFNFINTTSDSGNTDFEWDLGDKMVSILTSINNKVYKTDGTYTVLLMGNTINHCKDTLSKTVVVKAVPKADFIWDVACSKTMTQFTYTGSKPIKSFNWDFNNQGTSNIANPKYQFPAGEITTKLVVLADNGCTDTIAKIIEIKQQSLANFQINDVCENDSALFKNNSVDAGSFKWKFGDGTFSVIDNPKHKYAITKSTTFNVSLVAIVKGGCSDSVSKPITVNKNPTCDFNYSLNNKTVVLSATNPNLTQYFWTFGTTDSITKNTSTHTHQIISSDQYKICLTAFDAFGCSIKTCKNLTLQTQNLIAEDGISLNPNPNNGRFILKIEQPLPDFKIEIYNALGQLIIPDITPSSSNSFFINLENCKGIYIVKVQNGSKIYNYRIVIN